MVARAEKRRNVHSLATASKASGRLGKVSTRPRGCRIPLETSATAQGLVGCRVLGLHLALLQAHLNSRMSIGGSNGREGRRDLEVDATSGSGVRGADAGTL